MVSALLDLPGCVTGPLPDTDEWLAERKLHIGASEAAAACGLSPWRQPLDVYLEKRGLAEPREETAAMRLGKRLEPVIAEEYSLRTGLEIVRGIPMLWRTDTPHIAASLDALTEPDFSPLELKSSSYRRSHEFGDEGTDQIPDDYLVQVQQQMYVVGAEQAELAVLLDGRTLRLYTIRRHEHLIARMIELETELWQRIVTGDPPAPDFTHPKTPDLIRSLYGVAEGKAIDLPDEAVAAWADYQRLGEEEKRIEAERDALKAKVLYAIGDAAIADLGNGKQLTRSTVNRKEYTCKASSYVTLRERKAR